jgi:aminoglycoside phosphotransferase family enzyme/predicted kinase
MARTDALGGDPQALVGGLMDPAAYGDGVTRIRTAETHISWVFLTGRHAYKIKKPLKLDFLDFSTLELRKEFCEEEVRLNRRLAPNLYLGVVPIGGTPNTPRVGTEPAIEYAVKMREFPESARLDRRLDDESLPAALRRFAAHLARFHAALPPLSPAHASDAASDAMRDNFAALEERVPSSELEPARAWVASQAARVAASIDARAARGRYRDCHGDLHLENLLLDSGEVVAYDALEFDAKLREIDVASETAFLVMDLLAHDRTALAYDFLSHYLEDSGDYDGLEVLRFYLVHRAFVRAKVRAIKAAQKKAESGRDALAPYLALARDLVTPRAPRLLITHGLSGSGKTHVTGALQGPLAAVRARSDLERKRLHGLGATARSRSPVGGGLYDAAATRQTYERLAEIAASALGNGFSAIVDATFLNRPERDRFAALAERLGAHFAILDCAAPESVLRRRVAAREKAGSDASEAGLAVLDAQLATRDPLGEDELRRTVKVATDRDLDPDTVLRDLDNL